MGRRTARWLARSATQGWREGAVRGAQGAVRGAQEGREGPKASAKGGGEPGAFLPSKFSLHPIW